MNFERRDIFESVFNNRDLNFSIRPPHSGNELNFSECLTCEDLACVKTCPENILKFSQKNGVEIDFYYSGCSYCGDCVSVCQKKVLNFENPKMISGKIELDILSCVAWHGVICSSCRDGCLSNSIKFIGMFRPEIDLNSCNNCGFCISRCPNNSISIKK